MSAEPIESFSPRDRDTIFEELQMVESEIRPRRSELDRLERRRTELIDELMSTPSTLASDELPPLPDSNL